jgi:geranylgeranyl diphosphate synthase type II
MGLADSKRRAQELVDMALESLSPFGEKAEPLREIARYIVSRKS